MKKSKKPLIFLMALTLSASFTVMTGCGKKAESWAYDYDPTVEVVAFYDDGDAVYKGEKYTYAKDGTYINLSNSEESVKLRYVMENGGMTLYEKSEYRPVGGNGTGIIGNWKQDNGWTFTFLENGEFSEEDIFFGHYSVDEDSSCIRLMYSDPIPDAFLYYEFDGDNLVIDYPWPMTTTAKS